MQWAKPTHKSKGEIDRAGDVLISDTTSDEEKTIHGRKTRSA